MSKEQPEYAAPDWKQINNTVHRDGQFLFAISSSVLLQPGESEQLLSMIVREHNSHKALVDAIESRACDAAISCGLGVSEWRAFLTPKEELALEAATKES